MAHVKGTGTTSLGRDSKGQRLGMKIIGGQFAKAGSIVVRQRGTRYRPGKNVKLGTDDTLFATVDGTVRYEKKSIKKFNGKRAPSVFVTVEPAQS